MRSLLYLARRATARLALASLIAASVACDASSSLIPAQTSATRSITLDASAAPAYLQLDDSARLVTVADPLASATWDMAFFATAVSLNGGAAGPGGVQGFCFCTHQGATAAQLQAFSAVNQMAAFDSATTAMIPAATAFSADTLVPAISGWYTGAVGASATPSTRSWIVRRGTTPNFLFGRFHVTAISGASSAAPGQVTLQWATQAVAGGVMGADQTATITVAAGTPTYFDLTAGAVSSASGTWDLQFRAWDIRVNSGASGSGSVRALPVDGGAYASITPAFAAGPPASVYKTDAYGGVFGGATPWYRYNITGNDNQIWPTYDVYLVKRGTSVFKVQLTGYYDAAAQPRRITVRYARLAR